MTKTKKLTIILFSLLFLFVFLNFNSLIKGNLQTNIVSAEDIEVNADEVSSEINLDSTLQAYLLELTQGTLEENSFISYQELVFDGAISNSCNAITTIDGLGQFNFNNLTSITIRNMSNLQSLNLVGLYNSKKVFPKLNTIIIENCTNLTTLDFTNNTNLTNLSISLSSKINLVLDNDTMQTLVTLTLKDIAGQSFNLDYTMPNLNECVLENNLSLESVNLVANSLRKLSVIKNTNLLNFYINSSTLNNLIFQGQTGLQLFDTTNASNIKNIELDIMSFEEDGYIVEKTLLYAPNLKKLFISANDWIEEFDISESPYIENIIFNNCSNLKTLSLADELEHLQTLDLSNCYNLMRVDINPAINLQTLSLAECSLLSSSNFDNFNNMSNLQYLNLQGANIKEFIIKDLSSLQILMLGSNYLGDLQLNNLNNLSLLQISSSSNLKNVSLVDIINLQSFNIDNCDNVESIDIENVGLRTFEIAGKIVLNNVNILCDNLEELYVYDCDNLVNLNFKDCTKLKTVEILGCNSLSSDAINNFDSLNDITNIYVSECSSIYNFELTNKPLVQNLNLKNLNNLSILRIENIGTNAQITLPSNLKTLRNLSLQNLGQANFGISELNLSNGVLSSVSLVDVPFTKINLNDNYISSINISNMKMLNDIDLSNNRITNAENIITMFNTSSKLTRININNNRIDFASSDALQTIQSSIYGQFVVIGIQNVIDNNEYTYEPTIYYGGLNPYYLDIEVVIYHSVEIYSKASLTQEVLSTFSKSPLSVDKFTELKKGTYYITYQKVDDRGNVIEMTTEEKEIFLPIYFTVTTTFDFVQFIWIIFVAVAVLIFIYVGISFMIEKRRKARLLGEDFVDDGGATAMSTTLSRKEIKQAEREHRKLFKESEKLDKQERKNKALLDKAHLQEQKEMEREQKALNQENAKMQKLAKKEQQKAEKERLREEKEQQKLDKEREKLLKEREKQKAKDEKTKETKEPKSPKVKNNDEKKKIKSTNEATTEVDTKIDNPNQSDKDNDNMFKFNEKIKDKELKKEQKELKRLEKQNLKEERMREKAEDKALFSKDYLANNSKKNVDNSLDDFNIVLGNKDKVIEDNIEDLGDTISDKDLEEIMNKSNSLPPKKLPPKPPQLPKK